MSSKLDVVHLIGGLASAAACLAGVTGSSGSTNAILSAIEKLATEISNSPVSDEHIVPSSPKKTS